MSESSIIIGGHTVYIPEFEPCEWNLYPHVEL